MPQLRVGLAQIDTTVGDFAGNADLISTYTEHARSSGCHAVVFPEMTLTGYMPEDLVLRATFVQASLDALDALALRLQAEGAGDIAVVVGYCDRSRRPAPAVGRPAGEPQNACALIWRGRVITSYAKHHLPNYGVFDEFRYFVRGDHFPVVRLHGVDVGFVICEDLWQEGGPITVAREAGVGLLLCPNASPYERFKDDVRGALVARRAVEAGAAIAYVNLVGGQDELVYDGDSLVVSADGTVLARAPEWEQGLMAVDLDLPAGTSTLAGDVDAKDGTVMHVDRISLVEEPLRPYPPIAARIAPELSDHEEVWGALVTATRDYVDKNGFTSVAICLSGGIDSAVVSTIACDALGPDRVHVISMPSDWSSEGSVTDAQELAELQSLHWQAIPIAPMVDAYTAATPLTGLALENLQARVRGTLVMALSNQHGHLVLTCGNKSELATGFSTLYGDSAGGFAPIKDVPKTLVWELARWRNTQSYVIPLASIEKPASAELAPGQLDSDRLPDYPVLDAILDLYVEQDRGRADLLAAGYDAALVDRVVRLVDLAEYKRRQYPPGPKITPRAFGRDRRLPITSKWRDPQS
jgi:NAD+ synthase (glutamine-hydrolysing)